MRTEPKTEGKRLGVSPGRIRQLIMEGAITDVIKFSNRSLVSTMQVEAYDQERKRRA